MPSNECRYWKRVLLGVLALIILIAVARHQPQQSLSAIPTAEDAISHSLAWLPNGQRTDHEIARLVSLKTYWNQGREDSIDYVQPYADDLVWLVAVQFPEGSDTSEVGLGMPNEAADVGGWYFVWEPDTGELREFGGLGSASANVADEDSASFDWRTIFEMRDEA